MLHNTYAKAVSCVFFKYKTGQISGDSVGKIQDFTNKYVVHREFIISQPNHWTDLDIKKEARKRNRGVQSRKTAKGRRTAVKEKENRVDDDDETDDDSGEMGDDADGNENEEESDDEDEEEKEDENETIDQDNEEIIVITEVRIASDEDEDDDLCLWLE